MKNHLCQSQIVHYQDYVFLHVHAIIKSQSSTCEFVHLSIQQTLMSIYHVSGTVIGSGYTKLNGELLVFEEPNVREMIRQCDECYAFRIA